MRFALWLALPMLVFSPTVGVSLVVGHIVGAQRLGAALDAALRALGYVGEDAPRCTATVLRARLQRKAAELRKDPALRQTFTVALDDMY